MLRTGRQALFIVTDYFPSTGGPSTTARAFARELVSRGWTVCVATRRLSRDWARTDVLDGVHIHRAGAPGYGKVAKMADLLGTWWWLLRVRRRTTIVQAFMDPDYALAAAAAGLRSRTIVTWATLGDPARYLGPPLLRSVKVRLLRRCIHTALTRAMAEELQHHGIEADATIPIPFETSRFTPASPTQRREERARLRITSDATIIFTGHLEPRKGVDLLLQAFKGLVDSGASVHLLVVGGNHGHAPDLGPALRAFVHTHGLQQSVTFAGVVDDVVPYLHASDIFCLPSSREGMSNSLVEAMACGLACVAPTSAGGNDLLKDGVGIIPASNSPQDLRQALAPLVNDSDLRAHLGRASIERVRAHQLANVVDAYERLYDELPTRSGHRTRLPDITEHIQGPPSDITA